MAREIDGVAERLRGVAALDDGREIEDRQWRHAVNDSTANATLDRYNDRYIQPRRLNHQSGRSPLTAISTSAIG